MTLYRFEAFSPSGQVVDGVVEADSLPNALQVLRMRGVSPYRAEPAGSASQGLRSLSWGGPGLEWRSRIVRQLATLLAAGITLDHALRILASQAGRERERKLIGAVLDKVSSGQSLAMALTGTSNRFKADEIGLIKAGEQSGSLVPVLEELSTLLDKQLQLRGKLAAALVYPAFLLALAPLSLIIIATVLVPNIAPLFENSGAGMPLALSAMIWASREFQDHGPMWLAALIAVALAFLAGLRHKPLRSGLQSFAAALPVVRTVRRRSEASRICRTLGSLLRSGAALQTALSAVSEVATVHQSQEKLRAAGQSVSGGAKLATALAAVPSLDATALQMIAIGEETNKLDTMLLHIADTEEKALSGYIDRLMTLLTPLLTVVMGLLVGGIVMSIMRAILSVNELVAK